MKIPAYDECRLTMAMENLGDAFEYAVYELKLEPDDFFKGFLQAGLQMLSEGAILCLWSVFQGLKWQERCLNGRVQNVPCLAVTQVSIRARSIGRAGHLHTINGNREDRSRISIDIFQSQTLYKCTIRSTRQMKGNSQRLWTDISKQKVRKNPHACSFTGNLPDIAKNSFR